MGLEVGGQIAYGQWYAVRASPTSGVAQFCKKDVQCAVLYASIHASIGKQRNLSKARAKLKHDAFIELNDHAVQFF